MDSPGARPPRRVREGDRLSGQRDCGSNVRNSHILGLGRRPGRARKHSGFGVLLAIEKLLDSAPEAAEALRKFHDDPFQDEEGALANWRLAQQLADDLSEPLKPFDLSDF